MSHLDSSGAGVLKGSVPGQGTSKWHHHLYFHMLHNISLLITNSGYDQVPAGIKNLQGNDED